MSKIRIKFNLTNILKLLDSIKNIKTIYLILLILLIPACIQSENSIPSDSVPLTKWSTKQLVTKGKTEFANKNYSQSIKYLHEAAKRDDKEALYALGYIQYHGLSVPNNPKFAQDLIRRSAELQYEPAIKAQRLFLSTRSQFTVDSETPAYLDDINNGKNVSQNATLKVSKATTNPVPAQKSTAISKSKINNKEEKASVIIQSKNVNQLITANENNSQAKIIKDKNEASTKNPITNKQEPKIVLTKNFKNINQNWLNKQVADNYTIQVLADDNLEAIEKFISQNNLENKLMPFSYYYKDKLWYGAGFGVFTKSQDAYYVMLNDLPSTLASKKPWVRQFKNIHQQQNKIS